MGLFWELDFGIWDLVLLWCLEVGIWSFSESYFARASQSNPCLAYDMNNAGRQFEGLLSRYFERLLEDIPTFATAYAGLRSGEGKLGQLTLDFHRRRERERQIALRGLESISPRELSNEQHLDRL